LGQRGIFGPGKEPIAANIGNIGKIGDAARRKKTRWTGLPDFRNRL
jgi:hypothetical protein